VVVAVGIVDAEVGFAQRFGQAIKPCLG